MVHGWLVDGVTVCIAMGDFMGRKSVAVVVAVSCMVGVLVDWVVDLSGVLVCSNLVGHVKDVVRQLVIDMPVVVVIVVNDMSLNSLMVILSAIVILVWNIMELSMLMVGLVSMGCMVMIMLSMVCLTVMGVGVVLVIESSLVPIVVPVVLSISTVFVVVIASLVSVDVSWTVLVVMSARVAVMVSLCKDLVQAVGSVAPSLSVAGVRAVAIVVALISPVVDVVLSLKVLVKAIIVSFVTMVHVMMEELIIVVWISAPVVLRVSMITVPVVMVGYVPMLISSTVVLSMGRMVVSWLSTDWGHMGVVVVVAVQVGMCVRLHLQDQISLLNIRLRCSESCAIGVECGVVTLVPSVRVKHIEIVFPVEIKSTSLMVIGVSLNVVEKQIPGHVLSLKSLAPRFEGRSPEVHHN